MDNAGTLGDESKDRANLAIEIFRKNNVELILTIGWAYRNDIDLPLLDFQLGNTCFQRESVIIT